MNRHKPSKRLRFEEESIVSLSEGATSGQLDPMLLCSQQQGKQKRRLLFEEEPPKNSAFITDKKARDITVIPDDAKRKLKHKDKTSIFPQDNVAPTDDVTVILSDYSNNANFAPKEKGLSKNNASSSNTTANSTAYGSSLNKKATKELRQLEKSKLCVDKAEVQLGKAQDKLMVQKPCKSQGLIKNAGSFVVWRYAHRKIHEKIHEVEHENVGTEAAHKTELAIEGGIRVASRFIKRRIRSLPARRVKALSKKSAKAKANHAYKQLLHDNPALKKRALARFYHKQRLKMHYSMQANHTAQGVRQGGTVITKAAAKLKAVAVSLVKSNPKVWLILLSFFLVIMILQSCIAVITSVGSGLGGVVGGSSYLAEDADIDDVTVLYTRWEAELHYQIINAERDNPGYDEYRFSIGDISHNPFELLAFLTAVYHDFTYAEVQATLYEIFNEQYQLEFISEVEIRTRIEERSGSWEDDEGNTHSYTYTVIVEYEWWILNVILTSQSFKDVILSRMDEEQTEHFHVLMLTKGNRQYLNSPFAFNWLPYVTSLYGYRINPFNGTIERHWGLDIGLPQGTPILSGQDGMVVFATYTGGYGFLVVIDDGDGLVSRYAHCSVLYVSVGDVVSVGDIIARVGSTGQSTGPHLHLEVIKHERRLNPLIFTVSNHHLTLPRTTTDYITVTIPLTVTANNNISTPPVYITIPIITNHNPPIADFTTHTNTPIAPMSAEVFAVLIAEAESHLGTPYVFGANGPNAFDCSSFVCWVFTHSGVYHLPRTTAQGIFDQSTPIPREATQPGDLFFFTGTFSTTRTVTHVGIYTGNGLMIHAGSPVEYTSINTSFWERHFYSVGRLNW